MTNDNQIAIASELSALSARYAGADPTTRHGQMLREDILRAGKSIVFGWYKRGEREVVLSQWQASL